MGFNVEHEIDFLHREIKRLRQDGIYYREYIDTISSPLRKRIWWWFGGYKFRCVGRWYKKETIIFKFWEFIAKLIKCT